MRDQLELTRLVASNPDLTAFGELASHLDLSQAFSVSIDSSGNPDMMIYDDSLKNEGDDARDDRFAIWVRGERVAGGFIDFTVYAEWDDISSSIRQTSGMTLRVVSGA